MPTLRFTSAREWEAWLEENHRRSGGIWLEIARQDSGVPSVSYGEALDAAICFGWIDGQKGAGEGTFWRQRFGPRGPRSKWSAINRERGERLEREGRLRDAGRQEVERARQDGRWDSAYEGQRQATVPEDLRAALERDPEALAFFQTLSGANRYAILYRVQDAKRPETRARRIEQYVAMCREHRTLH
ncbi:MAG: YdeI/OmpD-associated family protein [Candidatus Dormibacteraeota bacterium]|nr:YdeI/OmpD-associated family protein [Candidatus Dormibacteraeota bacterium]MBO0759947.1 YdeI/OmpD-associated family protein [Candidatus Dormibacteraeota bacterium]